MSAICRRIIKPDGIYAACDGDSIICGISDRQVFARAYDEHWILITNDKDFGEMVFREQREHHGIIFLRLDDERAANKINVLRQLIANYSAKLPGHFVTVSETKVRFA